MTNFPIYCTYVHVICIHLFPFQFDGCTSGRTRETINGDRTVNYLEMLNPVSPQKHNHEYFYTLSNTEFSEL